jgi:hypothetical protein
MLNACQLITNPHTGCRDAPEAHPTGETHFVVKSSKNKRQRDEKAALASICLDSMQGTETGPGITA